MLFCETESKSSALSQVPSVIDGSQNASNGSGSLQASASKGGEKKFSKGGAGGNLMARQRQRREEAKKLLGLVRLYE